MTQSPGWPRIGALQITIIAASVFTAAVHIYLAVTPSSPEPQLRPLFMLAAVGYLGAVTASYAPLGRLEPVRWLARLALLGVTVGTFVAYFVVVGLWFGDALSFIDKAVEALLGLALIADAVAAPRVAAGRPTRGASTVSRT